MDTPESFEEKCDKLLYCLKSLADMGETISTTRSIEKATGEILHIVMGTIGASKGAILTQEDGQWIIVSARGAVTGKNLPTSSKLLRELEASTEEHPFFKHTDFQEHLGHFCGEVFTDFPVEFVGVLRAQKDIIGLLLLSKRFMKQEYTEDDLSILEMICRHLSVALYNFDLRKKIQASNFQLSRKVLQLESLYDIGVSLASFKPKDVMLKEVLQGSISLLDAKKAFFLFKDGETLKVGGHIGVDAEQIFTFIDTPFSKHLHAGKSLRLYLDETIETVFGTKTFLATPVKTSNMLFGALAIAGKESSKKDAGFSTDDVNLLEAFATQAAVALENAEMQKTIIEKERLSKELETAATIQKLIVPSPSDIPIINGYNIYGYNYPCKEVGGDYFDIIPISNDHFGFVICDVSGKGLSAALLVSTLQATFHSLMQSNMTLTEIAERANRILHTNTTTYDYASGVFGMIDVREGIIELVNAGHHPPLLLRRSGELEKLEFGEFCLGMFPASTYTLKRIRFHPGDILYLFTDGISEAISPTEVEFGLDRLERIARSHIGANPKALLEEIEQEIRDWTKQLRLGEGFSHDDFTHLAIQMAP